MYEKDNKTRNDKEKEINIIKKKFIVQYESISNKECDICKNNNTKSPTIKICVFGDKYYYINCLKKY